VEPALIVMAGTTGCGKTTIANGIVQRWPFFLHLEIDAIRKELAGVPAHLRLARSPLRDGLYSHGMSSLAYGELFRRIATDLSSGSSVVADGAFRRRDRRLAAIAAGHDAGAATIILELRLEHDEQLRRLRSRYIAGDSVSDAPPDVLTYHEQGWEPVAEDEADHVVKIDTMPPAEMVIGEVIIKLAALIKIQR